MDWEIVIGLETHVQLSTVSKIFSGTSTRFGAEPNTQACAVDLALPGTLPVTNRGAIERAIRFGLAIQATIAPRSIFARKHYFYPDLPKGYQISQYELPIVQGGILTVPIPDPNPNPNPVPNGQQVNQTNNKRHFNAHNNKVKVKKRIRILRAHLEEDAGKSLHQAFETASGIDLNRAGMPLLEIVTEPDMRSATEAVAYAKALHALVVWLGICDGNMQEGSFRCDANVSVRPAVQQTLGTRTEIKNLNSFRFLEEAIIYEARRQIELIEAGGSVTQETRLYDANRRETRSMRSKEDAQDYRYFPDPNLMPLIIDPDWIERARSELPALPAEVRERFINDYGLTFDDAHQLTSSKALATYYEAVIAEISAFSNKQRAAATVQTVGTIEQTDSTDSDIAQAAKMSARWITGELAFKLNRDELPIDRCPVSATQLARLLLRIADGSISNPMAKEVFQTLWDTHTHNHDHDHAQDDDAVDHIIEAKGFKQISDLKMLESIIDTALAAYPKLVDEFRAGKQKALNALVGQVMKMTQGKANPQQVNACLKKKLS